MQFKNLDKKAGCWFIDFQRWILRGKQIFPDVEIRTDVLTFYGNGEIQGVIGDKEEAKRIRIQEYERKMGVYKKKIMMNVTVVRNKRESKRYIKSIC